MVQLTARLRNVQGEAVTSGQYESLLAESGSLKLHATALLASDAFERRFDAAAVLHEVVRLEQRALATLSAPSAETQLGFAIERCWLFLEGLDPKSAREAWADVTLLSGRVPIDVAGALRDRIDKKYPAAQRKFAAAAGDGRLLSPLAEIPSDSKERARLRRGLRKLLQSYPGIYELWINLHLLEAQSGNGAEARDAIERARRLRPERSAAEEHPLEIPPRAARARERPASRSTMASFGREVRRRRGAAGITLEQLAERSGLSASYIGTIENGKRNPSLSIILALAKGFNVNPGELLDGSAARPPPEEAGPIAGLTPASPRSETSARRGQRAKSPRRAPSPRRK